MSEYQTIIVEREGAVDWLTLNRPNPLNSLTEYGEGTPIQSLIQTGDSK